MTKVSSAVAHVLRMGEHELTPVAVFLSTPDQVQIRAVIRCELAKRFALSERQIEPVLMLELMASRYRLGLRPTAHEGYYSLVSVTLMDAA